MSNLLKDKFPELLKEWDSEKNTIDLETLTYGSNKKVWWKCFSNHSYESKISQRTNKKTGCPYCANIKVGYGNDLKSKNSKLAKEWDKEKNTFGPEKVFPNSNKKFWWKCSKGHSYQSTPNNRSNGKNCPYCSGSRVTEFNNLKYKFPNIAKEIDLEKNNINPKTILSKSNKKIWWKCNKGHSWNTSVNSRTHLNSGCPFCSGRLVTKEDNLEKLFPMLMKEWDFEKNNILPSEVKTQSSKVVWWKCSKGHSYRMKIHFKTPTKNTSKRGTKCPICTGHRIGYGNDLKTTHPKLAKEWDSKKNKTNANEVTSGSNKKVWWKCSEGHSWRTSIYSRVGQNTNCPYCTNQLVGYGNDLKTTHPKLAKEWDSKKNKLGPNLYVSGSTKKVWWKCRNNHSYQTSIYSRSKLATGCPYCTLTPRSREEVYLLFELKQFFNIDANDHKIKLKRVADVDIKLANERVVIEYDGAYWHKDKAERDKAKTKALEKAGWTVIRVREKPLKVLSRKYNVSSKTGEYKETSNKVLKKLNQLGYEVKGLDKYLERKTLINKKEAENYIDKLLKEKNRK